MYFKVYNHEVMFGIEEDGELTPREGIILCEPIVGKLIDTFLEVSAEFIDYRRDVAKIIKSWDEEMYPIDKFVLLEKGGDYYFEYNGKQLIKSDHYFDDIMAVMDEPNWRNKEVLTHKKNHSLETDRDT